ncbi:hypothetical protein BT69DRAFT_1349562 [Atractiella rhizophila]|nr:hypothetical protein BT69DRAFT_1349562 [Atractiella rhizophila]
MNDNLLTDKALTTAIMATFIQSQLSKSSTIFTYDDPQNIIHQSLQKQDNVFVLDERQSSGDAIAGFLAQETLLRSRYVARGIPPPSQRVTINLSSRALPLLPHISAFSKTQNNRPRIDVIVQASTSEPSTLQLAHLAGGTREESERAWSAFEREEGDRIIVLDPFEGLRAKAARDETKTESSFEAFEILKTSEEPTNLIVIPASIHSSLAKTAFLASDKNNTALLILNRFPFDGDSISAALPSITKISLFSETSSSSSLQATLADSLQRPVEIFTLPPGEEAAAWAKYFGVSSDRQGKDGHLSFWAPDTPSTLEIVAGLSSDSRALTNYDAYALPLAGLLQSVFSSPSSSSSLTALASTSPSLLVIHSPKDVFSAASPLSYVTKSTNVLLLTPWTEEEIEKKVKEQDKNALRKAGSVWIADTVGWEAEKVVDLIGAAWKGDFGGLTKLNLLTANGINGVNGTNGHAVPRPSNVKSTSFFSTPARSESSSSFQTRSGKRADHSTIQKLLFSSPYSLPPPSSPDLLRPDLHEENYLLTVTENRRLTPLDYDRNVFHIEFSTKGTGLKYHIGDALGVHGWNDGKEVLEFIEWYGLDPDAVVELPAKKNSKKRSESRTIFQLFQQNLDVFGKPPKSFYERLGLSPTATLEEARILRFISSEQGQSMFRKWSELETELVEEIAPIKERHYSIASSQNAVGDSVHLLIVTVDWKTPDGRLKLGQCTRYLDGLKPGDKVMTSLKPSVMKLPPSPLQPIIMAGLGTGAAPFRAFLQEKAWQRARGIDIGPLVYYFGSRYSSKEYLYGEEIEAYILDGILTHGRMAFSRDGKKKVYIQHRMQEDGDMLVDYLKEGVFYLCGPTWPVPDVYEALCDAHVNRGMKLEDAQQYIERLKDEERYVLEVY